MAHCPGCDCGHPSQTILRMLRETRPFQVSMRTLHDVSDEATEWISTRHSIVRKKMPHLIPTIFFYDHQKAYVFVLFHFFLILLTLLFIYDKNLYL